jgi:hypothetical protein
MSKQLPRACLNLLLAAAVLVGTVLPPAIRHAHEGGSDLSHRHDGSHGSHGDHKSQAAHTDHAGHLSCDPSFASVRGACADSVQHFHFQWLGLQLMLPDDGTPSKDHGDRPGPGLVFVPAGREMTTFAAHANQSGVRTFAPLFQGVLPDEPVNSLTTASSSDSVTTTLLCDRARHERSGVQLT